MGVGNACEPGTVGFIEPNPRDDPYFCNQFAGFLIWTKVFSRGGGRAGGGGSWRTAAAAQEEEEEEEEQAQFQLDLSLMTSRHGARMGMDVGLLQTRPG